MLPKNRVCAHPGEHLREDYLPDFGWSACDLAKKSGLPQDLVDGLLEERVDITPEIAVAFARLFNQSERFWLKLQQAHDQTKGNG